MFGRLKRFLGSVGKAVRGYFETRYQRWQEANLAQLEREALKREFKEFTPLEEERIRIGYWERRW